MRITKTKTNNIMTPEEQRERVIQNLADFMRNNTFTFEFKVKKNPKGIKVIYEVTQEEMNNIMKNAAEKRKQAEGSPETEE